MVNINPLTGLFSGAASQAQKTNSKLQSTIESIVSGNINTQNADNVAAVAVAAQMQSQLGNLRQVTANISQNLSLTQTAGDAVAQEIGIVGQLQQLATQANVSGLNAQQRQSLNTQFQQLASQLDQIANTTSFNGQNLLNGTFSTSVAQAMGAGGDSGTTLSIGNLSAQSLFGGTTPDLLTQQGAAVAQNALQQALNTLGGVQSGIGSFSQTLDYAAASAETALNNIAAANSNISDTDLAQASTQLSQLIVQQNAQVALEAQANKLPGNMLDLLNNPPA